MREYNPLTSRHQSKIPKIPNPHLELEIAAEAVCAEGPLHGEGDLAALVPDGEGGIAEGPVLVDISALSEG